MELSDEAEEVVRTPLRKTKRLGMEREKEKLERRREAVAKFVTKETEEIEMGKKLLIFPEELPYILICIASVLEFSLYYDWVIIGASLQH